MQALAPTTKILILSADSDTCFKLVVMLKQAGLPKVTCMSHAAQALELCAAKPPAVILVDQELKGLSGWLFIKEFKTSLKLRNAAVVFFGKSACVAAAPQLKQYGILGYLPAPLHVKVLVEMISATMEDFERQGSVERGYAVAKASLVEGRVDEAVAQFTKLQVSTEKSVRSSVGLAGAYEVKEDHESAEKVISELPLNDDTYIPVLMTKTRVALKRGDLKNATRAIKALLAVTKDAPFYFKSCAELAVAHEHYALAEEIAKDAQARGFDAAEINLVLAKCRYATGDVTGAYEILMKLYSDGAMTLESLNLLGVLLRKLGKFKPAVTCYQRAMELAPRDEKLHYNLALCFIALGQFEDAKAWLEKALVLVPLYVKAQAKLDEVKTLIRGLGAA